jgi:hypothetical protein
VVEPNHYRKWEIDFGLKKHTVGNEMLYVRTKFYVAQTNVSGTYLGLWRVGSFDKPIAASGAQYLAADTFHEIPLAPASQLLDPNGKLVLLFENQNKTALMFPLEDGLEVLYRQGGFGGNFIRALGILLCSLILVSVLGLASASLMSFPVAAFFSISLLLVALSSGTLASVVQEGTIGGRDHETGAASTGWIDTLLLPVFKGILEIVHLVQQFSPVDSLSTGRSISGEQLALAFGQIVLVLGGFLAMVGIYCFSRRELATAQGHT